MGFLKELASQPHHMVNDAIMESIGKDESEIICLLASEFDLWEKKKKLVTYVHDNGTEETGFFYSTIPHITKKTGLTKERQAKAIDNLIKHGLLKKVIIGFPKKRYFKIDTEVTLHYARGMHQSVGNAKIESVGNAKIVGANPPLSKTYSINRDSLMKKDKGAGKLKTHVENFPPTKEMVEEYVKDRGYTNINIDTFMSYYESVGWKIGHNDPQNWKAAVTRWENSEKEQNEQGKQKSQEKEPTADEPESAVQNDPLKQETPEEYDRRFESNRENLLQQIENKPRSDRPSARPEPQQPYTPPTLEEVKAYCREHGIDVMKGEIFFGQNNITEWMEKDGTRLIDWKAKIRQI